MARYFLDHSVGTIIVRDGKGLVCSDDKAAIRSGQMSLSRLLSDHKTVLPWQHFEVIVRREDGANVGRLGMTLSVETLNPATAAALASTAGSRDHRLSGDRS